MAISVMNRVMPYHFGCIINLYTKDIIIDRCLNHYIIAIVIIVMLNDFIYSIAIIVIIVNFITIIVIFQYSIVNYYPTVVDCEPIIQLDYDY